MARRIQREVTSRKFNEMKTQKIAVNESNDCAVIALAIACDVPYEYAHEALKEQGRIYRQGVLIWQLKKALEEMGGQIIQMTTFNKIREFTSYKYEEETTTIGLDGIIYRHIWRKHHVTINSLPKYVDKISDIWLRQRIIYSLL